MKLILKTIYVQSDDPTVAVFIPAYPGAVSQGTSIDDARQNVLDAIADLVDTYNEMVDEQIKEYITAGDTVTIGDVIMTLE